MKYYKVAISFLALVLAACGSSPVAPDEPDTINGEWSGLIYQSSSYDIYLAIYVEDNVGIGSTEYVNKSYDKSSFYATGATFMGTPEHFYMHLDVGFGFDPPWAYTGYVKNDMLCLVRDAMPNPPRCLAPGPRAQLTPIVAPLSSE